MARVVFLDHVAVPSGAELSLVRLVAALDGVECHVILGEDGPLRSRLETAGATTEVLPLSPSTRHVRKDAVRPTGVPLGAGLAMVGYVQRLAARLRALQPDLVHGNSLRACVYGAPAARLAGLPFVWHLRDRLSTDYLPAPAVALCRVLLQRLSAGVVANSEATMATAGWERGRHHRPLPRLVVGNVTEPQHPTTPTDRIRRVGIVGRISPWKGQDVFLRAFAAAFAGSPVEAVVVGAPLFGEDAYYGELVRLCAELGITDRVDFRGHRDDVPAELRRLDVLVHASVIPEPFGQVITEGMAVGVPVIAAAAGGAAEILSGGIYGLLHTPGDVEDLTRALTRMAIDDALRGRLAEAGLRRAVDFAPDHVSTEVARFYTTLLGTVRQGVTPVPTRWGATTA